jgi:hypothetical protein
MYLESFPAAARRSAETSRRRGACRTPTHQTVIARARAATDAPRPVTAAARRARVDDAIVSQWLLDQLPSDHRHALSSASERHALPA